MIYHWRRRCRKRKKVDGGEGEIWEKVALNITTAGFRYHFVAITVTRRFLGGRSVLV